MDPKGSLHCESTTTKFEAFNQSVYLTLKATAQPFSGPRVSRPVLEDTSAASKGDEKATTQLIELVKDGELDPITAFLRDNSASVNDTDADVRNYVSTCLY